MTARETSVATKYNLKCSNFIETKGSLNKEGCNIKKFIDLLFPRKPDVRNIIRFN